MTESLMVQWHSWTRYPDGMDNEGLSRCDIRVHRDSLRWFAVLTCWNGTPTGMARGNGLVHSARSMVKLTTRCCNIVQESFKRLEFYRLNAFLRCWVRYLVVCLLNRCDSRQCIDLLNDCEVSGALVRTVTARFNGMVRLLEWFSCQRFCFECWNYLLTLITMTLPLEWFVRWMMLWLMVHSLWLG